MNTCRLSRGQRLWRMKRKGAWRIVAKALGPKEGRNEKEADLAALIRLAILISYTVTNSFIVAGVVRHWNN
jgi:hypothetical protein